MRHSNSDDYDRLGQGDPCGAPVTSIDTVRCEACEKRTAEPIYHADEGDAFCGPCVAGLLGGERDHYRDALRAIAQRGSGQDHAHANWITARDALRLADA